MTPENFLKSTRLKSADPGSLARLTFVPRRSGGHSTIPFTARGLTCATTSSKALSRGQGLALQVHHVGLLPTSTTKMKRLLGKKDKKQPKPPQQNIALGIPTHTIVGPLGFRAELDIDPEGDSYQDLGAD